MVSPTTINIYLKDYETIMDVRKAEIIEEIININYYLVDAVRKDNTDEVLNNKILLDNLIKLYLKDEKITN
jgi:hypothetical protein